MVSKVRVFGDSHSSVLFNNFVHSRPEFHLEIFSTIGKTAHSICRDKVVPQYTAPAAAAAAAASTFLVDCFQFGEVDCRLHVHHQVHERGRALEEVISTLVAGYVDAIAGLRVSLPSDPNSVCQKQQQHRLIVVAVVPPLDDQLFIKLHSCNGWLPQMTTSSSSSSNEFRLQYTRAFNKALECACEQKGIEFFDPFTSNPYYARPDGMMRYEVSDTMNHIADNGLFLNLFEAFVTGMSTTRHTTCYKFDSALVPHPCPLFLKTVPLLLAQLTRTTFRQMASCLRVIAPAVDKLGVGAVGPAHPVLHASVWSIYLAWCVLPFAAYHVKRVCQIGVGGFGGLCIPVLLCFGNRIDTWTIVDTAAPLALAAQQLPRILPASLFCKVRLVLPDQMQKDKCVSSFQLRIFDVNMFDSCLLDCVPNATLTYFTKGLTLCETLRLKK